MRFYTIFFNLAVAYFLDYLVISDMHVDTLYSFIISMC